MFKRIFGIWCAVLVCVAATAPVYAAAEESTDTPEAEAEVVTAADSPDGVSVSITDGVVGFGSNEPEQIKTVDEPDGTTVSSIGIYPYEIKYDNHNGSPVVIKSFKVPAGYDPASLIEADFEDNGYTYVHKDILKNDPQVQQETKLVAQTVTFTSADNEQATILSTLSPIIEYSEGGYSGQLELDYNSIQSAVAGTESYSYPITRKVEYNNLDNNDYIYLDKDLDGLTLQEADWTAIGGTQRGNSSLPSAYNATAVYTGIGYGSKVTGYNNMATYKGSVTRTYEGETIYSIIYQGHKIPSDFPWTGVIIAVVILAIIGGLAFLLFTKILPKFPGRKHKNPPVHENVPVQF